MRDLAYRVAGRLSLLYDWLAALRKRLRPGNRRILDPTGLLVAKGRRLEILWEDPEVLLVAYDSLAHSFWRAQELSLFKQHRSWIIPPVLDFGCGDGSFASVLFKQIEYGVDHEPLALERARAYGIYEKLLQSSETAIPLEDRSVQTVISNSVLEHTLNLDALLSEILRILDDGGLLIFTVPVDRFRAHLEKYFGQKESERVNKEYRHLNLLGVTDWLLLLERKGFRIELARPYQPDWFTFWYRTYRLLGNRIFTRIFPWHKLGAWKYYRRVVLSMIRSSLQAAEGANVFVIARKKERL